MKQVIIFIILLFTMSISSQTVHNESKEKHEAFEFLKRNLNGCFSLTSENVSHYLLQMNKIFDSKDSLTNDQYRAAYRSALQSYPFLPETCDTVFDSQHITTSMLMSHIDSAYAMWRKNSHLISFNTFCNYILPYRIGNEPLSDWRNTYITKYSQAVKPYLNRQKNHYYAYSIHNQLNKGFNGAVYYPAGPMPEFSLSDLLDMKLGNCESYSVRSVAQLRAFGIPATIDFIPHWGNRSMGHSWAVMFVNDTYTLPFGLNEALGAHFDERPELTLPKVYRQTFARQEWLKDICTDKSPYIPSTFKSQRFLDVTDTYVETSDVTINIQDRKWVKDVKWLYLAVFDNHDWVPVAFSHITSELKASFPKVGRGVVYIPFYNDTYGRRHYATPPFILDNDGNIKYIEEDNKQVRKITVARKYWESETIKNYNRQLQGAEIVVSNDADFHDSLIVAVIDSITENRFHTISLNYQGVYKFLKYISPHNSYGNIAEIEMYDDNDSLMKPIRSLGGRGAWIEHSPEKAFDGNELTSYSRMSADGAWAATEFATPVHLSKIRIHPRTDGNAIYAGDVYQLLYWKQGKWELICEHTAGHEDALTFAGVPGNSLLLLHNVTRGNEERIFTYEGGHQIWW